MMHEAPAVRWGTRPHDCDGIIDYGGQEPRCAQSILRVSQFSLNERERERLIETGDGTVTAHASRRCKV